MVVDKLQLQRKERLASDNIPYTIQTQDGVVQTASGDMMVTLAIQGMSFATAQDQKLNHEKSRRAALFKEFANEKYALHHTIIRKRTVMQQPKKSGVLLADNIAKDYQCALNQNALFANELYLTLISKDASQQGGRLLQDVKKSIKNLSHKRHKFTVQSIRTSQYDDLLKGVERLEGGLQLYGASRLHANVMQYFSEIINHGCKKNYTQQVSIAKQLPLYRYHFNKNGLVEIKASSQENTYLAAMLSLKEYPEHTYAGILDHVLKAPVEMVITQTFQFKHNIKMREQMQLQLRRMENANDPDIPGMAALEEAVGDVAGNRCAFGDHHFTIMVLANDEQQLEKNITQVLHHLDEVGVIAVKEDLNAEAAFWAQLPGNFRFIVRKMPISTHNYASFCALHNDNQGHWYGNHWGNAVALLTTPSGLPYAFNFHQNGRDRGHTLILGTTGSGKTFFMTFLLTMAIQLGVKIFYFDKDRGAEVCMRCLGADHAILGNGESTGFNPLQLADTPSNRHFLQNFLSGLLTDNNKSMSSDEITLIQNAVRHNYETLPFEFRNLANLAMWFGSKSQGSIRSQLDMWHGDGALSEFFGADMDCLQLRQRFFHFEMGKLLSENAAHQQAVAPLLSYLFHRIDLAIDGKPTLLVLDEAWKLFSNPQFENQLEDWLRTLRKRNVVVVMLTQDIMEIQNTRIGNVIRSMPATKVIFPDVDMDIKGYQQYFDLTAREANVLKDYAGHERRYALIKKPNESVVARLNGEGIKKWSPILSATEATLKQFDEISDHSLLNGFEMAEKLLINLQKEVA